MLVKNINYKLDKMQEEEHIRDIPTGIEAFLKDVVQLYGHMSHEDILKVNLSKSDIEELRLLMKDAEKLDNIHSSKANTIFSKVVTIVKKARR